MHWIDYLFPTGTCALCARPIRPRSPWACSLCLSRVARLMPPLCQACGRPLRGHSTSLCSFCRKLLPAWAWGSHLAVYEGYLQAHLHKLKFNQRRGVAKPLGTALGQSLVAERPVPRDCIVIPVPLHAQRLRNRGYNQAALIAHACADALRRPMVDNALVRKRNTEVQAKLDLKQRRANMRHAFWVRLPSTVRGRFVVLVDDIFTTGATCHEATLALLRAGASAVGVACVAVAVSARDMSPPKSN